MTFFLNPINISSNLTNLIHHDAIKGCLVVRKEKHRITVSLDEDTFENISRIANNSHVSIGWVIRYAVDYLLKEREESAQLLLPFGKKEKV